ncbi:MAG: 1-(5-phosphoribosyl)-5-[(5-phosphoribosylamino)methylideneamino]imidazole-4-carboxamide isomerase [Gemmatimonadota bacterium]|nr:1-(5-phosphoribosyl)-5-[(5-phosphoribosylamino)methylideneamino]imidazole-4-carboxamide isomerase [Gemmatimonadota bacterium]
MILYPAIDIRDGKAVRLREGDFARETVFDADPVDAAERWVTAGASWLHIVDLDGARSGRPVNTDAVRRIREAVPVRLQLGGGLRTMRQIDAAATLGIDRLVLGSAALRSSSLVSDAVARHGEGIAVSLDARDGKLASDGWMEQTEIPVVEAAQRLATAGVRTLIFTDIRRDGLLRGPNVSALIELIAAVDASVIASGGVGTVADICAVRDAGVAGVIIGRALYDGHLDLRQALTLAAGENAA